ncbi:hypothetical protein [Solidesulfovibrio magneticus]|uniref:Uncharacterized protein n=1 Tax=Solidesulfovibrio magneticus (strain ATCC 700980 / DSM 13731 / RS-1) TaxID=573370 RepID=C4XUL7_SOLM1|nr:hypothetical protein [Solidesulfovibrio magneticus]BAH73468.1 hypothetical protein DMR_p1_00520 [Solidesulfovibrio magneticus RS-1]
MPMYDPNANVAALARQALNGQGEAPDEEAQRKAEEARAVEEGRAEAEYQAARFRKTNLGEDEDSAFTSRRRTLRRISAGWEPLTTPSMPSDSLE